jgi:hypothetical protein
LAAVLLGLVLASAAPTPAYGQEDDLQGRLVFPDIRDVALDWPTARAGKGDEVCNVGAADATRLVARVSGFEFKRHKEPVKNDAEVVTARLENDGPLRPGDCRKLTVKAVDIVDAGTYTGVLAVTSAGAGLARRTVSITGPIEVPKSATAEGAVDTASLNARRDFPFAANSILTDNGLLPLRAAGTGERLQVPRHCPMRERVEKLNSTADEQELQLTGKTESSEEARKRAERALEREETKLAKRCPFVGNLLNGTDVASVFIDGPLKEPTQSPALLPLRVRGAGDIGHYEGSLDLAQTPDDPKDDVSVKVAVTDPVGWAILALLAGAALSLLSQYILRRFLPKRRLRERWRKFGSDYTAAKRGFDEHAPDFAEFETPAEADITGYQDSIDTAIKRYGQSVVWFDDQSEAYKQLDASLDQVEADIGSWRDEDGLAKSLIDLKAALEDLAKFLTEELPLPRAPRLVLRAAELLKPRQLKVGEAKTLAGEADSCAILVADWQTMGHEAKRYIAWLKQLTQQWDKMEPNERERLRLAGLRLAEALNEMLDVSVKADLEGRGGARDLRSTYDLLAALGAKYGWLPPPETKPSEVAGNMGPLDFDPVTSEMLGLDPTEDLGHSLDQWLGEAIAAEGTPARPAALAKSLRWIAGAFALVFSVLVGVAAGLAAFYFDGPWGTWEDYLTVIVVGTAAQLLVQGVVDTVTRLLPPLPDQLVAGVAAAKVAEPVTSASPVPAPAAPP